MDIVGVAVAAPPVATAAATVAAASNHTSHGHSEVAKVKNEPNAPHHHPLPEDDRNNTNSNNVNPRSLAAVRKRKFLRRTAAQSSSLKRIQNHPHTAIAATAVNVIPVEEPSSDEQEHHRPEKLFRGATRTIRLYTNATTAEEEKVDTTTIPIVAPPPLVLPEDLVQHTLSFLGTVSDRFALQTTCRQFHRLSNAMPDLLRDIPVGGGSGGNSSLQQQQHEIATGTDSTTNNEAKCTTAGRSHEDDRHRRRVILRSILLETDTPATASAKLEPFCAAGNLEAIYM